MAATLEQPTPLSSSAAMGDDPLYDPSRPWHAGEQEMHRLLRLPVRYENPTSAGLPARYGARIAASPLIALGTLDGKGRPWVSLTGGEKGGLAMPVAQGVLAVRAVVDVSGLDPVVGELLTAWGEGEENEGGEAGTKEGGSERRRKITLDKIVRPPNDGKLMAGLAIDLETRDRVKFAGKMIGGSMTSYAAATATTGDSPKAGEVQVAFHVLETLGNCPKYLNKKHITPHVPSPELIYHSSAQQPAAGEGGVVLPPAARELLDRADMFFLSSKHGTESMDVNHRGGPPGFMRVSQQERRDDGKTTTTTTTSLVYPEFSGNNLYQTLGNLRRDPQVGICVPDYDTGNVLYVTGTAEVLIGDKAAAYLPRTKLAVKVDIEEARFIKEGLGFRGAPIDHSPYNPTVRYLTTEKQDITTAPGALAGGVATARLKTREKITETVARYTFAFSRTEAQRLRLSRLEPWEPGQYITLDFSEELDHGWRHMADEDPQSLNDDYVRSFTISAPARPGGEGVAEPDEFEITIRRHGPVTALLSRWNMAVPLEVPVLGFAGNAEFRLVVADGDDEERRAGGAGKDRIFLAQGVGITPLMAQAPGVLEGIAADAARAGSLNLLWSLRAEDMLLAQDVLGRTPGLAETTTLFVTANKPESAGAIEAAQKKVQEMGAKIVSRRMAKDDVLSVGEKGRRKYYGCMSGVMRKALLEWMAD
ncbi:hypothetical protein Micbo1qcDRAFT_155852, partial [Microdochium bolleyi]